MNKNIISFKKGGIPVIQSANQDNKSVVVSLCSKLIEKGWVLSEQAFDMLSVCNIQDIQDWWNDANSYINYILGGGADFIYLNQSFPKLDRGTEELYYSAVNTLWNDRVWNPDNALKLETKYEASDLKELKVFSDEDFFNIFYTILSSPTALSPDDTKTAEWFLKNYKNIEIPFAPPFKETLCMVAGYGVSMPVKTSTDVLRIAGFMSWGDTLLTLPPKTVRENAWTTKFIANPEYEHRKFRNFKRSERRYILSLLDTVADSEEMCLYTGRWIRLGEKLHAGDYKEQFPTAYKAFSELRNSKVRSWYSKVDKAFLNGFKIGLEKLSERGGEYARRLDSLLRNNPSETDAVLDTFIKCKISNKVLFEMMEHFSKRSEKQNARTVTINGRSRIPLPMLEPLDKELCDKVIYNLNTMLYAKFSEMPELGKVYIDHELKNIKLPLNMRGLSESSTPVVRGSVIPFKADNKVLRLFVHWTSASDLDISAEFGNIGGEHNVCSFHNLKPFDGVYHSGDVIPDTEGMWAEYIDIELDKIKYRYVLITLSNYGGGDFEKENAVVGFMEREHPEHNKVWYPKTVTESIRLRAKSSNAAVGLFDLQEKTWILIDEDICGIPVTFGRNVEDYIKYFMTPPSFSVYHLMKLHAEARGCITEDKENADTVFKFDDFAFSYENTFKFML